MKTWKKRFFLIWSGQAVSLVGSGLVQFALVWWLTQTTHSAAVLASASLAGLLPSVFIGPFAGALVDRWDRKKVMILADSATAASTGLLIALFATGLAQPWHIYAILFIRSVCGGFQFPAMQASTSLMVPADQLTRIAGMNQMLQGILGIATPPLGALLLGLLPMYGLLSIDVITAATAVIPLLLVSIPQPTRKISNAILTPRALWSDVREGLRYVQVRPGLIAILAMAMVINFLFNPAGMLVPLLVTDHFGGGAWHLSLMESAFGIGIIAGSLALSAWGGFKRKIATTMLGLVGMGAGAFLTGLAPAAAFGLAVGGNIMIGVMIPVANGPLTALLQTRVEPGMQGRVSTVVGSCCSAMSPVGMILAAPVASWLGIQAWFLAAGLVTAAMGVLGYFIPVVMRIEDDMPLAVPAPEPELALAQN